MGSILFNIASRILKPNPKIMANIDLGRLDDDIKAIREVGYKSCNDTNLSLDIFWPKNSGRGKLPVLLWVHGGGLVLGDKRFSQGICQHYAKRGFLVFSLDYRTADQTDGCHEIDDVCAGIEQAGVLIPQYNGDPDRVYMASESAGSFLALYAVASGNSEKIRGLLDCRKYGLDIKKLVCLSGMFYTDRQDIIGWVYSGQLYGDKLQNKEFRSILNPEDPQVVKSLCPLILVSSNADFLKSYTLRYNKALENAGHPVDLIYYEEGRELTHAFPAIKPGLKESIQVVERTIVLFNN